MCQAIREMRMEEREEGRREERIVCSIEHIRNLMDSLKCTAESAMEMLKIPESEQKIYSEKL